MVRWIAGRSSSGRRKQALNRHLPYGHLRKVDATPDLRDFSSPLPTSALCNNGFASYGRTASRCALSRSRQRLRLFRDARTRVGCSPSCLANCLQPYANRVTPGPALHIAHHSRPCSSITYVLAHAAHFLPVCPHCLLVLLCTGFAATLGSCLPVCVHQGCGQPPHSGCT